MSRRRVILLALGVCGGLVAGAARAQWPFSGAPSEERQALLKSGQAALEDGLYEVAESRLTQYLQKVSGRKPRAEGALLLARALFGQKRYEEVIDFLTRREGWARGTDSEGGFVLWRAMAEYELGRYQEARTSVEDFKTRFPGSPYRASAARLRAKSLLKLQEISAALEAFARFQENYPDSPDIPANLLDWAGTLIRLGKKDEARDVFAQLLRRYPDSEAAAQGQLWLGGVYMEMQDWPRAAETFAMLGSETNARPEYRAAAWMSLAEAQEARTNQSVALEALLQVSELTKDPVTLARAEVARGKLLVRLDRVEEGLALLKGVISRGLAELPPGPLQLDLAEALLAAGRFELSEQEFQHYLEAFSDPARLTRAWRGKAWSLWELRRYAEAAEAFDKVYALSEMPADKAAALFKIGDCFFLKRQFKQALENYRRLIREFSEDGLARKARYQAADCLAGLEQRDEAEKEFQALAKDSDPDMARQAALRIAQIQENGGRWEDALASYQRLAAACADPSVCAQAIHSRGLIRYRLGQFQEALSDFEKVVRDYPKSPFAEQAFYMRGWALYLLGQDREALALCRQFIERYPRSVWAGDVLFWLGEYSYNRGDYAQAEQYFAQLADRYAAGELADDALFWAGRSAAAAKEYVRAIDYYSRLAQSFPDSPKIAETRFAQGDALSELGQFGGAILAFEEIILKYPTSYLVDLAWGRKGDCQFTLGSDDPQRYPEALNSYRRVLESPRAGTELKWQAEFKMARCKEKMGHKAEAFEQYMNVVYAFLAEREKGAANNPLWFTRSAFNAAAIMEADSKWREAARIYRRVAEAGVPASAEAQTRLQRIRFEHWMLF